MQPPAEHVHWLFATGFLLLGAAACSPRRSSATRSGGGARWRAYLWPGLLFGLGVLMWPVMVFFTNSTIHMIAHGSWAQVMMLAGAAELGLVRGKLHERALAAGMPLAFVVSGAAFLIHEQNALALRALRLPAPRARLDAARRRALPARRAPSGRARSSSTPGFALDARRDRGVALLRIATSRRSSATSRRSPGCRTDEARCSSAVARWRSRCPRRLRRTRRWCRRRPAIRQRARALAARACALQLRPEREGAAERDPGLRREGTPRLGRGRARAATRARRRAAAAGCRAGAYTVRWTRDLGRRPRRLGRLHVRRPRARAAADRGVRRLRADDARSTSSAGSTSSRSRCSRRARLPAARAARRR